MPVFESERENFPRWSPLKSPFFEFYDLSWSDRQRQSGTWLRFALLHPKGKGAEGRIWAVHIDEKGPRLFQVKSPLREVRIERDLFFIDISSSPLFQAGTHGKIDSPEGTFSWDLSLRDSERGESLIPFPFSRFTSQKIHFLVPQRRCRLSGSVTLTGQNHSLDLLPARQTHLWGRDLPSTGVRGECQTFREEADAAFEGISWQIDWAGRFRRFMTTLRLRTEGKTHSFGPFTNVESRFDTNRWHFEATHGSSRIAGHFEAPFERIAGYRLPPLYGKETFCHQTTLADLHLELFEKKGEWKHVKTLTARGSSVFEVLRPSADLQIPFFD